MDCQPIILNIYSISMGCNTYAVGTGPMISAGYLETTPAISLKHKNISWRPEPSFYDRTNDESGEATSLLDIIDQPISYVAIQDSNAIVGIDIFPGQREWIKQTVQAALASIVLVGIIEYSPNVLVLGCYDPGLR